MSKGYFRYSQGNSRKLQNRGGVVYFQPIMEWFVIAGIGLVVLFLLFKVFKAFVKWTVILLVALFLLAFFTNPKESAVRDDLKKSVKERRLKKVRDKSIHIDNYKFFSLVKLEIKDRPRTVGVAAFGQVWYFDNLDQRNN